MFALLPVQKISETAEVGAESSAGSSVVSALPESRWAKENQEKETSDGKRV